MLIVQYLLAFVLLIGSLVANGQKRVVRFETRGLEHYQTNQELGDDDYVVLLDQWHKGTEVLEAQLSISKRQLLLIPNNREVRDDQSSNDYYRKLKSLAKDLKKKTKHKLPIWSGCAGPEVISVNDHMAVVYVDTEWFFHPEHRAEFTNTRCKTLWEVDFWSTLTDEIDDLDDKMVCIVGHHSIYQESKEGSGWSFLFPYNGPSPDFDSRIYRNLRRKMLGITEAHPNVMYLSLNASKKTNIFTDKEIFASDYDRIDFIGERDGSVIVQGTRGIRSAEIASFSPNAEVMSHTFDDRPSQGQRDTLVATGAEYGATGIKRFWLGDNYREEWTTPVKLQKLYVDEVEGGLIPYAKGGGAQTHSLKFKDAVGRKFAFRSVNKDSKKNKGRPVMQTVFGEVKQDFISSQLPYGDVVVGKLLDQTDILHVNPVPYIMAGQSALGKYNESFAGVIGTLEEKPTKKNKNREGFAQADKIVSTHEVYRKLLKSTKHQIDRQAYARCVMFDIWIADWDRHHDNWKWAMHEQGDLHIYTPIPRDRDHAFAVFEGVIGNVSDVAAPNVAELRPEIVDVKGMTFQGKSMLYFLGSNITRSEWNDAARYIGTQFNNDNIEAAWNYIPEEIRHLSKDKIVSNLISRKADLVSASNEVYQLMNEKATFYGSNKHDILRIDLITADSLLVTLSDKDGTPKATNSYGFKTTKQLEIYTLDGKDEIQIFGAHQPKIDLIIVPGTDKDEVTIEGQQSIKIYDTQRYDNMKSHHTETPIYPNIYGFQYDALLPFAMYQFDGDYGAGLEFKLTKFRQKFNKEPFGSRTIIAAKYFPRGQAIRLGFRTLYTDVYQKLDASIKIRAAHNDTRYDRYLGADVILPDDYQDNYYRTKDYYVQNDNIDIYAGLVSDVYGQSLVSFGLGTQYLRVQDGTGFAASSLLDGGDIWQTYAQAKFDLDFTDAKSYPTKGIRYKLTTRVGYNLDANQGVYNNSDIDVTWYNSWRDLSRTILVIKIGASTTIGNSSYIDYPILGNGNDVRGFSNNLIRSSTIGFVNTEIRKEIHRSENRYLPFLLGVTAFYDRGVSFSSDTNDVSGYGGGLYMTFLNNAYTVFINNGWNTLNDNTIIHYGIGFSL